MIQLPAGELPFKADSVGGLYDAIIKDPLKFPDDIYISDSLRYLLSRLLNKDPETRLSLVGAMNHPWTTQNGSYPLPILEVSAAYLLFSFLVS